MKRWNKRGVEPITIVLIIFGVIVTLFIANEVGLFSIIYTPPGTPTALSSYVNRYFYDTAVPTGTSWECSQQQTVNFRTSNLNYNNGRIEYTSSSCGSNLNIYNIGMKYSVSNCVGSYGGPIMTNLKKSWIAGSTIFNSHSGGGDGILDLYLSGNNLYVCEDDFDGTGAMAQRYDYSTATTGSISTDISKEMTCGVTPIQDLGKFTCENNNVVTKYCVFNTATVFPSEISGTKGDTCAAGLPCQFQSLVTIPGIGAKDIVKCQGDYKPNLQICASDGERIHNTDSFGTLTTTLCGVNSYNVCTGNNCVKCLEGTSWCTNSKTPSDCTGGQIVNRAQCPGSNTCSASGTAPNTIATCVSEYPDGYEDCLGDALSKTPQVFDLATGTFSNKYAFGACRTSCTASNLIATCSNECTSGTNYCEAPIATLYKCDVNTQGNQKVYYNGQATNSQCLSGTCLDANTCGSSLTLNYEYCIGLQRNKAVSNLDPLTGGLSLQELPVPACLISCVESGTIPKTTSCQQTPQCVGKSGGTNVCKDPLTVGTCNSVLDGFTSTQNCQATYSNGFCNQPATGSAFCDVPPVECAGNYGCSSDGKIYNCNGGYFDISTVLENCNNLGCSLTDSNVPSPINSQCTDACIGNYGCLGGNLFSCITRTGVIDFDTIQKVQSASQQCTMFSCSDASSCTPIKAYGRYCNGNILQESVQDMTAPLDGYARLDSLVTCALACDVTSSNPPNAKCRSAHEVGTYCVSGELWESQESIESIATGGTVQFKVVTCDLACDTISGTAAKCRGENEVGTYCEGANTLTEIYPDATAISSGGVRKRTLATCAAGCTGTGSTSAECDQIHEIGTYCVANDLWQAVYNPLALSDGFVTTSKIITCADSCLTSSTTYASCSAKPIGRYCVGANELWEAVNDSTAIATGGVRYSQLAICNKACEGAVPTAKCSKIHEEGTYCDIKNLMQSVTNTGNIASGGVDISLIQSCNLECQEAGSTAQCVSQCDGATECVGNEVKNCNSGILGTSVFTCASNTVTPISCTEGTTEAKCTDLCSLSQVNTCTDSKSYICEKNSTTQQNVNRLIKTCSIDGCGTNGFCKTTGVINSTICRGESLYSTDLYGEISLLPKFICSNEQPTNGLNPYCKESLESCAFCEYSDYYCINGKTQFQCANEVLGTKLNEKFCDAGCGKIGGSPYCDSLVISITGTTNFPTTDANSGDINLQGKLKGSSVWALPVSGASIISTIVGTGVSENANPVISGSDGSFSIPFQSKPKGTYTITMTVLGNYTNNNNVKSIQAVITDSFIVSPYESNTIFLIPDYNPKFKVKVVNSRTGGVPDGLKVSSSGNLTLGQPTPTTDPTVWEVTLALNSPTGQYAIGFKPTQGITSLDEQTIQIEVSKPKLTATLNNPESTTKGKKEYRLQIAGPKYETGILKTGPIKPDLTPKATVTYNSVASDLSLLDNGGGEYLVNYEFVNDGTYTINVEASKSGYDSATLSKLVEVSSSGAASPPSTDGSGTSGGTTGGTVGGIGDIGSTNNLIIIGIVGVIIYLIATGRKKR